MHPVQELVPWDSTENLLSYPVLTGVNARLAWQDLSAPFDRVVVVADQAVWALHETHLGRLAEQPVHAVPGGESAKTWGQLQALLDFLAAQGCGRNSLLLTVGGGSISDLGGLAASLFKRGIAVGHLPTTLLAQVDASVGGKTAINLPAGKNLVGTFHAPRFVLADPRFLQTLPIDEWRSGLGEVLKSALLARKPLWRELGGDASRWATPEQAAGEEVSRLVAACVVTKAQWVQTDPTEANARKALNLGHTFGHALEHAAGYGQVPHGVAVAFGLRLALQASARTERLAHPGLIEDLDERLEQLGLPRVWSDWDPNQESPLSLEALRTGMRHDKKGAAGQARFVLPIDLGRVVWDVPLESDRVDALWEEVLLA